MSESNLSRAAVMCAIGGSVALLFTLWGLSLVLLVAAGVLYGRLHSLQEQQIAAATQTLLDETTTIAPSAPTQTAQMHLEQLLNDAGLNGESRG